MFNNPADPSNCFIDIQAGAGGTEACDWAACCCASTSSTASARASRPRGRTRPPGDVAGIKGATIKVEGDYAFGHLRTETGVHRLVRKSPFDSAGGRHTSFASLFVYPEVDDSIEIDINPADVRTDTFRASGAGGQHINKTDSAVRLTHIPTGIVVQCQDGRSQHSNRDVAWKRLRSRLYDHEMRKRQDEQQKLEDSKTDVGWGHQIRSYVLDQSRIKDLRTNVEISNTQKVLDGDLDTFIAEPEAGRVRPSFAIAFRHRHDDRLMGSTSVWMQSGGMSTSMRRPPAATALLACFGSLPERRRELAGACRELFGPFREVAGTRFATERAQGPEGGRGAPRAPAQHRVRHRARLACSPTARGGAARGAAGQARPAIFLEWRGAWAWRPGTAWCSRTHRWASSRAAPACAHGGCTTHRRPGTGRPARAGSLDHRHHGLVLLLRTRSCVKAPPTSRPPRGLRSPAFWIRKPST
jgi:peptide chain release factor 2